MHNSIIDFVNRFEILYPLRYGFQKNHSTVSLLIYLLNKIATSIDQSEITVGIFSHQKKSISMNLLILFDTKPLKALFTLAIFTAISTAIF
jgi:hypothetical protein